MDAHRSSVTCPTARSEGMLVEQIGDEAVVFDSVRNTAHCLSPLATAVYMGADGRTRREDLAEVAASTVGEPVSVEAVDAAVGELQELGLIEEPSGMTRRTMVGRTAMATAALSAAPLVTSIVTPAGAASATLQLECPPSMCASQSEGDKYCNCLNTCEPTEGQPNEPACAEYELSGVAGPQYDSCECELCPYMKEWNDQGGSFYAPPGSGLTSLQVGIAECEKVYGKDYYKQDPTQPHSQSNWKNSSIPCSSKTTTSNGAIFGCEDTSKPIDGVCYVNPGDSGYDGDTCDPGP
jgi:hypothetical protein